MPGGSITNALIRCTRGDREAEGLFELVREDLGLWVLELDFPWGGGQAEQLAGICRQVREHAVRLRRLGAGSADYTLHLTVDLPEGEAVVIAPELSGLAADCGFNVELYTGGGEEG